VQRREPLLRFLAIALAAVLLLGADLHVWVDEQGVTHATNDAGKVPLGVQEAPEGALPSLWGGDALGELLRTPPGATSSEEDRTLRALRGAVEDLGRGETTRAAAALRQVLRREPGRPEPHFYLALLEGQRGHYEAAEAHLHAFLDLAGDALEPWRVSARRRLARIADERRLLASPAAEPLRLVALKHPAFRILADRNLLELGAGDFAQRVARYLDDAYRLVTGALGVQPAEPIGVVLYGRAAYTRAFAKRFSFQTVGFFDGRIHVVSAAHPAGQLRTLLVHEFTHALFYEQVGGHRPFWLNEGLAELFERASQQRPPLSRGERSRLRRALAAGDWIPLARLAPSFAGLDDDAARLAYRISTAAADWLQRHSLPGTRARLLKRLGEGVPVDQALRETLGRDTSEIDAAVREELRAEFPEPLPARSQAP